MSGKAKENAALHQSILNLSTVAVAAANVKSNAPSRGTKRTLTVKADVEFSLDDAHIPATKEVVEAMRRRIIELEEALKGQPSTKRAKVTKVMQEEPKSGPSTSSTTAMRKVKVDSKKLDAILKKFWTSLQKEVKTEKYKFRGGPPKTCRIDEIIEPEEFDVIFYAKLPMGGLVQPTPTNKPTSTVTIIEYGFADVESLFGKHYKELKGNRYSVGGICARFAKGQKIGLVALNIRSLEVSYAKNTMKCSLKFEVDEATEYRLGRDEDFDANGYYKDVDYAKLGLLY